MSTKSIEVDSKVQKSFPNGPSALPLQLSPQQTVSPIDWARENRDAIEALLVQHGAILFRGFSVTDVEDFKGFLVAICGPLSPYFERSSPRTEVSGNIFTSTDYPPDQPIFLHNEQSYNRMFPRHIAFFCKVPPEQGGETPIADCRRIFRGIPDQMRTSLIERRYRYVRNYRRGLGLPWQTVFQTDDPNEVERYCQANEVSCEWLDRKRLRTHQIRSVAARHPISGEETWFNHLTFFHFSTLPPATQEALLELGSEDSLPNNTFYGDGQAFEPEVVSTLREIYQQELVSFPWKEGDVLLLDNMLTAHGRKPFSGSRSILTAMATPTPWTNCAIS